MSPNTPLRVVVIGSVAAGPKTAARLMRLRPDAQVTVIEKGTFLSYAGCGLPYYVSGVVAEQKELMATPVGVVRDAAFFEKCKGFRVRNRTEALEIDRAGKRVRVRALDTGEEEWIPYDKLMLATGAQPVIPPIPGANLDGVFTMHSVEDAEALKERMAGSPPVVIIGGGLIGVEAAEAFADRGCKVTLIEMLPHILNMLDEDMALLVQNHMTAKGVRLLTSARAEAVEGENGKVTAVTAAGERIPAGLVLLAIGVRPNVGLARAAGLDIGPRTNAVTVDDRQRTSDPDIYAAGDCAESRHLVTGEACYVPLGSTANKQGRVAATNMAGGDSRFPGIAGSAVCKVFDFCVGRTGLTEAAAREAGFKVVTASSPGPDQAHYMPTHQTVMIKAVADAATRRLLGVQVVGPGAGDRRIDAAAMAITAGFTIDQVAEADLCYAPPYSPAMDPLITVCDILRNKLDGLITGLSPATVRAMLDRGDDFFFLDVRSPGEWEEVRLPKSTHIPLGAVRARLAEIPKDKDIVVFCKASLRGYEAARILVGAGFTRIKMLDGGVAMWPYAKETGKP
jgi:NADPH-dependent 2,4-dienoyl-CoA reductase/sulfur reductase-like enzyme/rhodanese-related sulfurtransferase